MRSISSRLFSLKREICLFLGFALVLICLVVIKLPAGAQRSPGAEKTTPGKESRIEPVSEEPSVAPAVSVSGTLTTSDPTFNRPLTCAALSGVGTAARYDAIPFSVTSAGTVTLSFEAADGGSITPNGTDGAGPDMFMVLYTNSFNPAAPLTNCTAVNDDINGSLNRRSRISTSLAVGSYVAVVTAFNNVPTTTAGDNALPWTYNLAINGGVPTNTGSIVISEFRLRGPTPNAASNEFIEIMNRSTAVHTVVATGAGTGYGIAASDGVVRCTIPNGTVIPANGHYLCVNSVGYSLASYPAGDGTTATGDATYTTDIPDNAGIALFSTNVPAEFAVGTRLDAVGSTSEANVLYKEGTGYPAITGFNIDHAFHRIATGMATAGITDPTFPNTGIPFDSNNNAADFVFVDTNGTSAGAGQRLGAPGPENLSGPTMLLTGFVRDRLDPCVSSNSAPNFVRDLTSDPANNSTFGTIDLRRTYTNTTGGNVTRLRFRILKITTFPAPSGTADLRPRTSSAVVVTVDRPPCGAGTSNVTVQGTTLEQPPSQPNGGGFNSSMSAGTITLATPLANGASIDLRFLFGIQQTGTVRGSIVIEALPRGGAIWNFGGDTETAVGGVVDVSGPTAAAVSISGRVLTPEGRGIRRAQVTLTGPDGIVRIATTAALGYYRFDDITPGETYVLDIGSKSYHFTPRAILLTDNLTDVDFTADP